MTCPNCTGTTARSSSSGCGCDFRPNGIIGIAQPRPGTFIAVADSTTLDAEIIPDGNAVALAETVIQVGLDDGRGNETIIDGTAATTEQVYPGITVDTRLGGGVTNIPNGDGWWSPKYGHPTPHYESGIASAVGVAQLYEAFAAADPSGAFDTGSTFNGQIPVDGIYLVTARAFWTGVTPGDPVSMIVTVGGQQRFTQGVAANNGNASTELAATFTATAGDTIDARFGGGGGGNPGTFASGDFSITYIANPYPELWRP